MYLYCSPRRAAVTVKVTVLVAILVGSFSVASYPVSANTETHPPSSLLSPQLSRHLSSVPPTAEVEVLLALRAPSPVRTRPGYVREYKIQDGVVQVLKDEKVQLGNEVAIMAPRAAAERRQQFFEAQLLSLSQRYPALTERLVRATPPLYRSSAQVRLTGAELAKLDADKPEELLGIERNLRPELDMASAVEATDLEPETPEYRYTNLPGSAKVLVLEEECMSVVGRNLGDYATIGDTWDDITDERVQHSIKVTSIVRFVSPETSITCKSFDADDLPADFATFSVATASNSAPEQNEFYSSWDRDRDNAIRSANTPIFQAATNFRGFSSFVGSPGKSFNSITVGAYLVPEYIFDPKTRQYVYHPRRMWDRSNWQNGETGYEKPEISAPGVNLSIPGIDPDTFYHGSSGTSYATPHAAALYANYLMRQSELTKERGFGAAFAKATMLKGAVHDVEEGYWSWGPDGASGVGGISWRVMNAHHRNEGISEAIYLWNLPTEEWYENATGFEGPNNERPYVQFDFQVNRIEYNDELLRFAMAWLSSGDKTYEQKKPGKNFDLIIIKDEEVICESVSELNTYEVCTLPIPDDELLTTYQVRIVLTQDWSWDEETDIDLALVAGSYTPAPPPPSVKPKDQVIWEDLFDDTP